MTTVAAIADAAFDAVAAEITDAIKTVTLTRTANGTYNPATGTYATTTTTQTGRAVLVTETPVKDIFPAHIVGPKDQLWLIEGLTALAENDALTIGSGSFTATRVQDVAGAGSLFYAVVQ